MREIFLVGGVDLCRDLYGDAGALGDLDSSVRTLFGGNATEEREIAAALLVEPIEGCRQSVIDRRHPIQ